MVVRNLSLAADLFLFLWKELVRKMLLFGSAGLRQPRGQDVMNVQLKSYASH